MPRPGGGALREIRMLFNLGRIADRTDGELLERFLARDGEPAELAFAALVERHGPMVLRTCRAVLRDEHESRDAFQATFQVLLRKARSLRVRDSLGPWLHQVALRTARCSRARSHRRRQAEAVAAEASAARPSSDPVDRHDLGEVLHLELSRLPDRYRSPVVLCCLEGLSIDQAARRLGWPLGTVQSRLARGRKTLRDRLARRGIAPSAGSFAALLAAERAGAAVPIALAEATVVASSQIASGTSAAGVVPAAVLALTEGVLRSMFLTKLKIGTAALAVVVVGGGSWAGSSLLAVGPPGDKPASPAATPVAALPRPDEPEPPPDATAPDDEPSLAEQYSALRAEYEAKEEVLQEAVRTTDDPIERSRIREELSPDRYEYCRRMIELAERDPGSEAARDALVWVIHAPSISEGSGRYGDAFALASALLVRHHGNDPDAVRVGIGLENALSIRRDTLLLGFYASARDREAAGLARMALAKYLARKAEWAEWSRISPDRRKGRIEAFDDDGRRIEKEIDQSDDEYAYTLHLRQCDPETLRAEAERLFEEIIANYADIPHVSQSGREFAAQLSDPDALWNGRPLTEEERRELEHRASHPPSLGQSAERELDALRNLGVGKPAPEIEGPDLDGNPMSLSEHRGKVVLLYFWASGCGECLIKVPQLRAMAERFEGRPFVLLGVNCDDDLEDARRAAESEGITWPSWAEGCTGSRPIARRYNVRSYPTAMTLDAEGTIRSMDDFGSVLDQAVATLVDEAEAADDPH